MQLARRIPTLVWYALASVLPPVLVGVCGIVLTFGRVMSHGEPAPLAAQLPPSPMVNGGRPVVAILASNAGTEVTDLLVPYAVFAESGAFEVVTVAPERRVSALWPGVDLVPDFSFAEFNGESGVPPALIVVPATLDPANAAIHAWLRTQAASGSRILSICEGARTVAAAGLLSGRRATTHFFAIDSLATHYPDTQWVRDVRYVSDGPVMTSAGVTAAADASLAMLSQLAGSEIAARTAAALGYTQHDVQTPTPVLSTSEIAYLLLTAAYHPSHTDVGVALTPGVSEFQLAAVLDAYTRALTLSPATVAERRAPVRTAHGLTLVPQYSVSAAPAFDELLLPAAPDSQAKAAIQQWAAGSGLPVHRLDAGRPGAAFDRIFADIAVRASVPASRVAAKMIEYPTDHLRLDALPGARGWPVHVLLLPLALSVLGVAAARWVLRTRRAHPTPPGSNDVQSRPSNPVAHAT